MVYRKDVLQPGSDDYIVSPGVEHLFYTLEFADRIGYNEYNK